jgi:hypothetical protein
MPQAVDAPARYSVSALPLQIRALDAWLEPPAGVPEQDEVTTTGCVETQPVENELQVMVAVPGIWPETTPAEVISAIAGLLLVHEPGILVFKMIVSNTQTPLAPVISGVGSTAIVVVALHPPTV